MASESRARSSPIKRDTLALETPARSATSSMVTRLRWAAEKVVTVQGLSYWTYGVCAAIRIAETGFRKHQVGKFVKRGSKNVSASRRLKTDEWMGLPVSSDSIRMLGIGGLILPRESKKRRICDWQD